MAKQKQMEEPDLGTRQTTNVTQQVQADMEKEKIRVKKAELDQRITTLTNNILDAEEQGSEDDFNVTISKQFLEVACTMQDVMKTVENLTLGMDVMFDTLDIFDSFMNLFDVSLDKSLQNKYTFGSNLISRIKTKRAIKNTQRRVEAFVDRVGNIMTMANSISDSMTGLASSLNTSMKRRKKKQAAKAPTEKYEIQNATAKKLLAAKRAERGMGEAPAAGGSDSSDTKPQGGSASGGVDFTNV